MILDPNISIESLETLLSIVGQRDEFNLENVIDTIESVIAWLDQKISRQIDEVIHHKEFQALESAWLGLNYLVENTEIDQYLKIRVINISKKDLGRTLKKFRGTLWDQSPLFKKLYEEEYGTSGGEPYGCLIGDFYFSHNGPDVEILKGMAQIAAASHMPFIAGADPMIMNLDSWSELANPQDLTKIFNTPDYAAWRSFRESDDSRYVALTLPRTLARLPYGPNTDPVDEFDFEENAVGDGIEKYGWMNSAYALGNNINSAFKTYGWCARIRGIETGGVVDTLPVASFQTDLGLGALKTITEVAITDKREAVIAHNGFIPLCHCKNTDYAVFISSQSIHKPEEFNSLAANANAVLSARLPYIFAVCRFAHYLKCIVRDKISSFQSREDMQRWMSNWISEYVTSDLNASEETKAKYPLAEAEVIVEEVADNPGFYNARFYLLPHFQLEGLTASLKLITRLNSNTE